MKQYRYRYCSRYRYCNVNDNLIEYCDNYAKTSGFLWHYFKDDLNDNLVQCESFKSKIKITGKTPAAGNTKHVEIIVPLKYLSNFWRTLEMPLINCEVNLILTWSKDCVITNSTGAGKLQEQRQSYMFLL